MIVFFVKTITGVGFGCGEFDLWKSLWKTFCEEGKLGGFCWLVWLWKSDGKGFWWDLGVVCGLEGFLSVYFSVSV